MSNVNLSPEAQAELAKLAIDLANNPDTRRAFANLTKKVDPKRRFPDVEAEELEEKMNARFDQEKLAREAEKAERKLERERAKLAESYDDDALKEIEKIMESEGIASYATAAKIYAADTKPATPTPQPADTQFEMPKFEMKDFGNLNKIRQESIYKAIDELRGKRN